MTTKAWSRAIVLLGAGGLVGCGGSGGGKSAGPMLIVSVSNGFGKLLPHEIHKTDASGTILPQVIEIRSLADLVDNFVSNTNPVLPVQPWPAGTILPNGVQGNHFVFVEFTRDIDVSTVLDTSTAGGVNFGLLGSITVVSVNPANGQSTPVPGRAFIGGRTVVAGALQQWVLPGAPGGPPVVAPGAPAQAAGFPGVTGGAFAGVDKLTKPSVFVYVVDLDADLATLDAFPGSRQIKIKISTGVKATLDGSPLVAEGHASSTVGVDGISPEVLVDPVTLQPSIVATLPPNNNGQNVSPLTTIEVEFTEPVQPHRVGSLPNPNSVVSPSAGLRTSYGPSTTPAIVPVPFTAEPVSPTNLARYILRPLYPFPGSDPGNLTMRVTVAAVAGSPDGSVADLRVILGQGGAPNTFPNVLTQVASTNFDLGQGPGLANLPVAPDAVYIGRNEGGAASLSVIDLNGFGQGTGNPVRPTCCLGTLGCDPTPCPNDPDIEWWWDQLDPTQAPPPGNQRIPTSKFAFNPNVNLYGAGLVPPLVVGSTWFDGGSGGVFTLSRDTTRSDRLARTPILSSVSDMGLGQSLDRVFNNGANTCAQGHGGNPCSNPGQLHWPPGAPVADTFNSIQYAPHPNPPRLRIGANPPLPPLCSFPVVLGDEPTAITASQTLGPPPPANLLAPGNAFGNPNPTATNPVPTAPDGFYFDFPNTAFFGPVDVSLCNFATATATFGYRQQVGHFLYVIDSVEKRVAVFNSNTMTLLTTITLPNPTKMAISPDIRRLGVTNFSTNTVSFIDIEPTSNNFHRVVKEVAVGKGPLGIAWQTDGEDVLVCNFNGNSLSILDGGDLSVRKTVSAQINRPLDVAALPRQSVNNIGAWFFTGVYLAYILNQNGTVAIYESGPDGANGIGFNDMIGLVSFNFPNPRAIQPDIRDLNGGAWVLHQDGQGRGRVSRLHLQSAPIGPLPLTGGATGVILPPGFRDKVWTVDNVIDHTQLSGSNPTDIAVDDPVNIGALPQVTNLFTGNMTPALDSSKQVWRIVQGAPSIANFYRFLFISHFDAGKVDVIDRTSGLIRFDTDPVTPGIQSIEAPGASVLCHWWRQ